MSENVSRHYVWVCDICGKVAEGDDGDDYPDSWEYDDGAGEDRCDACSAAAEIHIQLP